MRFNQKTTFIGACIAVSAGLGGYMTYHEINPPEQPREWSYTDKLEELLQDKHDIFKDFRDAAAEIKVDPHFEKAQEYLQNVAKSDNAYRAAAAQVTLEDLLKTKKKRETHGGAAFSIVIPEDCEPYKKKKSRVFIGEDFFKSDMVKSETDQKLLLLYALSSAHIYKEGISVGVVEGIQLYRSTGYDSTLPDEVANDEELFGAMREYMILTLQMNAISAFDKAPLLYKPVNKAMREWTEQRRRDFKEVLLIYAEPAKAREANQYLPEVTDPRPHFALA